MARAIPITLRYTSRPPVGEDAGLTHLQIEDDAQVNHVGEDDMSDTRSPATDDIVSPASQDSQAKPHRLDTMIPACTRADSDDAPPSVIHAPANFKEFVRVRVESRLHYMGADL